jgi:hypothetical protein
MEKEEFQKLLILFLTYRFKDYENSFYLYRALERMFGMYDYRTSIDDLLAGHFVKGSLINNVDHYILTDKGVELLNEKETALLKELKEKYLSLHPEYIKNILSYSAR